MGSGRAGVLTPVRWLLVNPPSSGEKQTVLQRWVPSVSLLEHARCPRRASNFRQGRPPLPGEAAPAAACSASAHSAVKTSR